MKTVVIVEDEYRTRNGIKNLIPRLNPHFQIIGEAEDGIEGIEIVKNLNPDIVFSDIKMPKINGLKMIEDIKEMGFHPTFVLLTGFANFDYAQQAIRLGVEDYILKPISIEKMKNLLDKLSLKKEEDKEEGKSTSPYSPLIQDIITCINTNYSKHINLNSIARSLHLSSEYISAKFTKETGENFSSFLKRIRIENAKILLIKGNDKIYEVATKVGYDDAKYFSRVFKEYNGISASEFIEANDIK